MNIDNDEMETEIAKILLQNGYADERHFDECISELKELFAAQRQSLKDALMGAVETVEYPHGSPDESLRALGRHKAVPLTAISTIFEGKE